MHSNEPQSPPRTVNRWTLEPIAILLPFLSVALSAVIYTTVANPGSPSSTAIAIALVLFFMVVIVVPTIAAVRKGR